MAGSPETPKLEEKDYTAAISDSSTSSPGEEEAKKPKLSSAIGEEEAESCTAAAATADSSTAIGEEEAEKPKLEEKATAEATSDDSSIEEIARSPELLACEVRAQVEVLERYFSWSLFERAAARHATHVLAELAKIEEAVSAIVEGGAVPALVKHLQEPPTLLVRDDGAIGGDRPFEHHVERWSALALFRIAMQPEHQQLIAKAGALPLLVNLLKRHKKGSNCRAVNDLVRVAANVIITIAVDNSDIKEYVRVVGGIPPLVQQLESIDEDVQIAAASALSTLASNNESNKNQIVECKALPILILMLQSVDPSIHCAAVCVIGKLVRSSPNIEKEVLHEGALQPVIGLLSSPWAKCQSEAALLLGLFASADSELKVQIVQRGALRPLIEMLQSSFVQLKETSVFALGRLAQESHNQAGIVFNGGLVPLLKLLDSEYEYLQYNAAFALFGIAENEDNVADFVELGGVQRLQDSEFVDQEIQYFIENTLKRLEEKINGRVLMRLLYLMRVRGKAVQKCVALALAHFCPPDEQRRIFIDNNGINILLELLSSDNLKQQQDGSLAVYKIASKAMMHSSVDAAPPSLTPQVYLGEQYVNNSILSDVTFLVEGKCFYAHRITLAASSDAFRAMFGGGCTEDARDIEIPNIKWEIFELMMRYIYSGSFEINNFVAQDLLRAADQYLLMGLKRLCEDSIKQDVNIDNVSSLYELSEAFDAISLKQTCILFILEQFKKLSILPGYCNLIQRSVPDIRDYFDKGLKPNSKNSEP